MENPWLHLRNAKDEEIPLFASALLIAKDEYPQLADASYKARLREYTRRLRRVVNPADPLAGLPGNPQTVWKRRALETLVERATVALG